MELESTSSFPPEKADTKDSSSNENNLVVADIAADHNTVEAPPDQSTSIAEVPLVEESENSPSAQIIEVTESTAGNAEGEGKEEVVSPLQVANSSPLTSVEDLHDVSRESFLESKEIDSEIDDDNNMLIDSRNSPNHGVKEDLLSKPQTLQHRSTHSTVKYVKSDSLANPRSDDGIHSSNKSDDQRSIPSTFKRVAPSEDSGVTDSEEGIMLPGRKKALLPSQINSKDRAGRSFIFKYAANGDYAITEMLLKAGASLRIVDNAGWTPLHEACLNGHEKVVEMLLSYDADVDAPGGDGDTPLHDAIGNGHYGVVYILLRHGASLHLHNESHQTPEEFAIEKYESLSADVEDDETLLPECQTALKIVELLKEWKEMTEKVVNRNHDGQTLFHLACSAGDTLQVQKLLDYGADINATDNSGWTSIHNAALNGRSETVLLLLRFGSEVDPLGMHDETPLHDAVANGHIECVYHLLEYGAEPFRKNRDGKMPIDLVPADRDDIRDLLNRPLDFWHPVKTPEYFPRLLKSSGKVLHNQDDQPLAPKPSKREIPQHWEGLEPRGSFESSREEKKFQALLKTLSRTDNEKSASSVVERAKPPAVARQPQTSWESSKSTSFVAEKSDAVRLDMKKKRPIVSEAPIKRPKLNPTTTTTTKDSQAAVRSTVKSKEVKETIAPPKSAGPANIKNSEPPEKIESGILNTESLPRAHSSVQSQDVLKKKPPKPKVVEKPPPPISKLHLALAEAIDPATSATTKKKKRFFISGYQAAGESSTEVSSESVLNQPPSANASATDETIAFATIKSKATSDSIPSTNVSTDPPKSADLSVTPKLSLSSLFQPKSSLSNNSMLSNPASAGIDCHTDTNNQMHRKEKVDSAKKLSLEKNLCLPLCAYVKPQAGAMFFKPINITREGLWGKLPKLEHTKVFVDMQIAYCLGLKNGRELLEKYPSLDSRVATTVEKAALEETVVSSRLFSNMILTTDPAWIPTTTINGTQAFKMTDVDIHLIFWTETLFRILSDHVSSVEKTNLLPLDWLEDIIWPLAADEPTSNIISDAPPKSYVHKLKRMRM